MINVNDSSKAMGQNAKGEIALIEKYEEIIVSDNTALEFLDKGDGIKMTVGKNSSVKYIITANKDYERSFDVYGDLEIIEINTKGVNGKLSINLLDTNAKANVRTLSIITDDSCNLVQVINHKSGYTFSEIKNVGVALNGANIMFDTTGKIEAGMAKSKCAQLSRGIVMDDISSVSSRPILLIDEYDCFANHGAAIGKMSDDDLFYLMSRGLSKRDAFILILKGIINPFLDELNEAEKDKIMTDINSLIVSD